MSTTCLRVLRAETLAVATTRLYQLFLPFQVTTDFMAGEIQVKYLEDETTECTLIGIPYSGSSTYFYVFLPVKDSSTRYQLTDTASRLTYDRVTAMIDAAESKNVTLTLPKVKVTSSMSLKRSMVRAITRRQNSLSDSMTNSIREPRETEDLSMFLSNSYGPSPLPLKLEDRQKVTFNMGSASDDFRFKIDDVLHRVDIDINEEGTEAVGVTSTIVDYIGETVVKVKRLFVFLIRHELTGAHLFWGAVKNPK